MVKFVSAVAAMAAFAGNASASLIDFETFPDGSPVPNGTLITNQYASLGVSGFFTTAPDGPQVLETALTGQSGSRTLGGRGGAFDFVQPITITFSAPMSSASILALDVGEAGLILEAFLGATRVDSTMVVGAGRGLGIGYAETMSVSHPGGFDSLTIRQALDGVPYGDGYLVDDLNFTTVPGPGVVSVAGLGLLAATRRRRR